MIKNILRGSIVSSIFFISGCATSEGFDRELDSFLSFVIPTFTVETESGYTAYGKEYKQCMRSCVSHSKNNQCVKYTNESAAECNQFIGK